MRYKKQLKTEVGGEWLVVKSMRGEQWLVRGSGEGSGYGGEDGAWLVVDWGRGGEGRRGETGRASERGRVKMKAKRRNGH